MHKQLSVRTWSHQPTCTAVPVGTTLCASTSETPMGGAVAIVPDMSPPGVTSG